jgi:hypothetical protein
MYKPYIYLPSNYLLSYLSTSIYETYLLQNCLPRWNQILTRLGFIHNWRYNGHPEDGALVGARSLWPQGWGGNWDSNSPTLVATCIHLQLIKDAGGYKLQPLQQFGSVLIC